MVGLTCSGAVSPFSTGGAMCYSIVPEERRKPIFNKMIASSFVNIAFYGALFELSYLILYKL